MAKVQKWSKEIDGVNHTVEYKKRSLFRRASVTIDGTEFPLVGIKLFSAHEEAFRLGDCRAVLSTDKHGNAQISVEGETVEETV